MLQVIFYFNPGPIWNTFAFKESATDQVFVILVSQILLAYPSHQTYFIPAHLVKLNLTFQNLLPHWLILT